MASARLRSARFEAQTSALFASAIGLRKGNWLAKEDQFSPKSMVGPGARLCIAAGMTMPLPALPSSLRVLSNGTMLAAIWIAAARGRGLICLIVIRTLVGVAGGQ